MNSLIFRKDDIRGVVYVDWDRDDLEAIGKAWGTWLLNKGEKTTVVGFDNRLTSEKFAASFTQGVLSTGTNVTDIKISSTPLTYWSQNFLNVGGGAVITGSHTPPEWNGVKMIHRRRALHGQDIQELKEITLKKDFSSGTGKLESKKVLEEYKSSILDSLAKVRREYGGNPGSDKLHKIKVVTDCGNGVGGMILPDVLRQLNCEVVEIHSRPDGTFPNHFPNPALGVNILELNYRVREEKADLGIAVDGDVDRINVIDNLGYVLWGDGVTMFLARDMLRAHPGCEILFNPECSPALKDDIVAHGGVPTLVPTGHSLIQAQLVKSGGFFAGEYSGHIYYNDEYIGIDDAAYAACRFVEILQRSDKPLAELMRDAPAYKSTGKIEIPSPDKEKYRIVEEVGKFFESRYFVDHLDGALIKFKNGLWGWALLRASDNTPKLNLMAWAKDYEMLEKITNEVMAKIQFYL